MYVCGIDVHIRSAALAIVDLKHADSDAETKLSKRKKECKEQKGWQTETERNKAEISDPRAHLQ
jgi:hypothetical protein